MTAPDPATIRVTANQRRAALAVVQAWAAYATAEALADAVALAVLTAEDDRSRRVVVVHEPGALRVFGPYATPAAAEKAIATGGLATRPGARGAVLPLIPAPRAVKAAKGRAA